MSRRERLALDARNAWWAKEEAYWALLLILLGAGGLVLLFLALIVSLCGSVGLGAMWGAVGIVMVGFAAVKDPYQAR